MEPILVKTKDIPEYISNSSVFKSIFTNNPNEILISKKYYFRNYEELFKKRVDVILDVLRFWNINPLPYEVLK